MDGSRENVMVNKHSFLLPFLSPIISMSFINGFQAMPGKGVSSSEIYGPCACDNAREGISRRFV